MSEQHHELKVEFAPSGKSHLVTVRLADEIIWTDTITVAKAKNRERFIRDVLKKVPAIDGELLEKELMKVAQRAALDPNPDEPRDVTPLDPGELLAAMPALVREQAKNLLQSPQLIERIADDIQAAGLAGERPLGLALFLVGVSRHLDSPLAAIVQGISSSGKSYAVERIASMFPPEAVVQASQITPQALFYMPQGSLRNKWVVCGERSRVQDDETAEATRALREMISGHRISKLVTMKVDGKMETVLIEQDGPIAFVESTTLTNVFDEDANRCIMLQTDEREQQTRRIIQATAAKYAGQAQSGTQQIIDRHNAMQRMIKPLQVVIPYAERLGELFDTTRVEARRAFSHLVSTIQATALLHQFQRSQDRDGRLLAAPQDYQLARLLLGKPLARQLGKTVSDAAIRFYDRVQAQLKTAEFTIPEVMSFECFKERSIRNWVQELRSANAAELVEEHRGQNPAKWRLKAGVDLHVEAARGFLPSMEQVFPDAQFRTANKSQRVVRKAV